MGREWAWPENKTGIERVLKSYNVEEWKQGGNEMVEDIGTG